MIQLKNISKTYGEGENAFQALKNINLNIAKGEMVAIMGASGSGKSTLMNILGALDQQFSGNYILDNIDISNLNEDELANFRNTRVGFIFQQFNLLQRTSVFDNVALPGLYGGLKDLETRVKTVLNQVGILDKMYRQSNEISGGQIQRVAIARALIMNPAIIMADEPTGNLDTATSLEIMKLFQQIHEDGNTVILITHEPDIAAYCERIIKIKDGKILSDLKSDSRK